VAARTASREQAGLRGRRESVRAANALPPADSLINSDKAPRIAGIRGAGGGGSGARRGRLVGQKHPRYGGGEGGPSGSAPAEHRDRAQQGGGERPGRAGTRVRQPSGLKRRSLSGNVPGVALGRTKRCENCNYKARRTPGRTPTVSSDLAEPDLILTLRFSARRAAALRRLGDVARTWQFTEDERRSRRFGRR